MYVAERHDHGELDAGGGRRRLRADAHAGGARAVPRSVFGAERPACVPVARPPGGAHAKAQHALPDRRLAADERDVARRRRLGGSDRWRAKSGQHTQLASLELAIESGETAGACDVGFAAPTRTRSPGAAPTTPLPTENNPRVVFERLFGDSGSTDPKARRARMSRTGASSTR